MLCPECVQVGWSEGENAETRNDSLICRERQLTAVKRSADKSCLRSKHSPNRRLRQPSESPLGGG